MDLEELRKYEESPVYFYNKYIRKDGTREITQEEWEEFKSRAINPLKYRIRHQGYPLTSQDCFKPTAIKENDQERGFIEKGGM